MDATRNNRQAVFTYLMTCDAKVKVSTAALIGETISHDYVVVHEAPPIVVKEIIRQFTMVSLRADGLLIPIAPFPDTETA